MMLSLSKYIKSTLFTRIFYLFTFLSLCLVFLNTAMAATIDINGNLTQGQPGGGVSGDDYNFLGDHLLTIPDGGNIGSRPLGGVNVSVINSSGNDFYGKLVFQGTSAVLGNIGTAVAANEQIDKLTFNGLLGRQLDIYGDVYVQNLEISGGGSVIFHQDVQQLGGGISSLLLSGIGTQAIVYGDGNFNLIQTNNAAILTFYNQADSASDVTASGQSIINFNGVGSGAGALATDLIITDTARVNFNRENNAIAGNVQIAEGATLSVKNNGVASQAIGGILNSTGLAGNDGIILGFDLNNTNFAVVTPMINVTGAANINADTIINISNVNAALTAAGTTSEQRLVVSGGLGGIVGTPTRLNAPDNLFVQYALDVPDAQHLNLKITRLAPTKNLNSTIAGVAGELSKVDTVSAAGQTELLNLFDNLADITDITEQQKALKEITPLGDGAIEQGALGAQTQVLALISQRASEVRLGLNRYHTGYSAGYTNDNGYGSWVKLLGAHARQLERNDTSGYHSETRGLSLGIDKSIGENKLVGLSGSFAQVQIDHDLNHAKTEMNYYQGALYGSWNSKAKPLYVDWTLLAAKNRYQSTRYMTVGNLNEGKWAEFYGMQYGARAELGQDYGEKAFHFVPMASLAYSHLNFDKYREKGRSTSNQIIKYHDVNALLIGVGAKVSYDYKPVKSLVVPEAHVNVAYDVIGHKQKVDAQFVQFGQGYQTIGGAVARTNYNAGISLTAYPKSDLGISLAYDYNAKSRYKSNSATVKVRYEWI